MFANIVGEKSVSTTEDFGRLEKKMTKLKFSAFGKVKLKPQVFDKKLRKLLDKKNIDVEEDVNERLLEIQREAFEEKN